MSVGDTVILSGTRYTVLALCENPGRCWLGRLRNGLVDYGLDTNRPPFPANIEACNRPVPRVVDTKPL